MPDQPLEWTILLEGAEVLPPLGVPVYFVSKFEARICHGPLIQDSEGLYWWVDSLRNKRHGLYWTRQWWRPVLPAMTEHAAFLATEAAGRAALIKKYRPFFSE